MSTKDSDNLPATVQLDAASIARDLAKHNPDLSPIELHDIAVLLIEEIQTAIKRGDRIGVIHQNKDGSLDISYLTAEPVKSAVRRLIMRKRP